MIVDTSDAKETSCMIDENLLPNLLIIGAAKAGTTALHKYLNEHPQIFMTPKKEPRFFLVWDNPGQMRINEEENHSVFNNYNTIEKYAALFINGKDCIIRGESSPQYLSYTHCAAKIKKLLPDVKIIAVLRNPIDRAFSHYTMNRYWQIEKAAFDEAVEEEIKTGRLNYPQDMRYLCLGNYAEQLKPYLNLFSSKQMKIYLYDDLKNDSKSFLKDIFRFLGVDENFIPNLQNKHNVSLIRRYSNESKMDKLLNVAQRGFRKFKISFLEKAVKNYRFYKPEFKSETREKLISYYKDEISTLEKILDKDLSHWKK